MLNGRINRKTFIYGNLIALAILIFVTMLVMIPVAILELVMNNKTADSVLNSAFYLLALPVIIYIFYICVLMVKRAHDLGWPGLLISIGFVLSLVLAKVLDINYFNMVAVLVIVGLAIMPGAKKRNNFGPTPRKKFSFEALRIHV